MMSFQHPVWTHSSVNDQGQDVENNSIVDDERPRRISQSPQLLSTLRGKHTFDRAIPLLNALCVFPMCVSSREDARPTIRGPCSLLNTSVFREDDPEGSSRSYIDPLRTSDSSDSSGSLSRNIAHGELTNSQAHFIHRPNLRTNDHHDFLVNKSGSQLAPLDPDVPYDQLDSFGPRSSWVRWLLSVSRPWYSPSAFRDDLDQLNCENHFRHSSTSRTCDPLCRSVFCDSQAVLRDSQGRGQGCARGLFDCVNTKAKAKAKAKAATKGRRGRGYGCDDFVSHELSTAAKGRVDLPRVALPPLRRDLSTNIGPTTVANGNGGHHDRFEQRHTATRFEGAPMEPSSQTQDQNEHQPRQHQQHQRPSDTNSDTLGCCSSTLASKLTTPPVSSSSTSTSSAFFQSDCDRDREFILEHETGHGNEHEQQVLSAFVAVAMDSYLNSLLLSVTMATMLSSSPMTAETPRTTTTQSATTSPLWIRTSSLSSTIPQIPQPCH